MAGTSIVEIIDLFSALQADYRLISLYDTSGSVAFTTYQEPWLLHSIDEFAPICNQSLAYSTTTQEFTETLNQENKDILADLMIKYWLEKLIQDVLQMNNNITDHDFKMFSQAQNLKAKQDWYNSKKEDLDQRLSKYAYRHFDWTDWFNQIFGGV